MFSKRPEMPEKPDLEFSVRPENITEGIATGIGQLGSFVGSLDIPQTRGGNEIMETGVASERGLWDEERPNYLMNRYGSRVKYP
jgi:hypothetical protein